MRCAAFRRGVLDAYAGRGAVTAANKGALGDALQLEITSVTGTPAGAHITIRGTTP